MQNTTSRGTGDAAGVADVPPRLRLARPVTLVEQIVDAIVTAATQGRFLPGDRLNEAEIGEELNVSRVPVREALRYLESYGIAVRRGGSRGVHMMPVTHTDLRHTLSVRASLEKLAVREALAIRAKDADAFAGIASALAEMERATAEGDVARHARSDTELHRRLCEVGGNEVLLQFWESLSRKLTIIFALAATRANLGEILDQHVRLLEVIRAGRLPAIDAELDEHILRQTGDVDFDAAIAARRAARRGTRV